MARGLTQMTLALSEQQVERYSRHILLRKVGGRGQRKLLAARVLIVGAGGLGSPVALYLAAAGIGTIGVVDCDAVELSNLQRQVLHRTVDVGRRKCVSAKDAIEAINPEVQVIPHDVRLDGANVLEVIAGYDVVVDGSDNFPTRYLVNDACVMARKPLSHAGLLRFEGQVITIIPGQGPCYRCLYPEPPAPGLVPSCGQEGVLGAAAGVIGAIQAVEVMKLVLSAGQPLASRLLMFDALDMSFREIPVMRDPRCAVCGQRPTVTHLVDYDEFCHVATRGPGAEEAEL